MARHSAPRRRAPRWVLPVLLALGLGAGVVVVAVQSRPDDSERTVSSGASGASACGTQVRVVAAASFAPVLSAVQPAVAEGPDCARLDVVVADGREAAQQVVDGAAHAWIPDDAAWTGAAGPVELAEAPAAGAGTVLALSPLYMVTDEPTAHRVTTAGGGWLGLADLVTGRVAGPGPPVTVAVRDPAGSGDGLLAAGALGEAVWLDAGMDASAEALATALPAIRTVSGTDPALPSTPGEVGLVPEHALLPVLRADRASPQVIAANDHTAALRFSWHPTAAAAADPVLAPALDRVREALTGADSAPAFAAAGLRRTDVAVPPRPPVADLPAVTAPMFDVLGAHHVDHVFATWYPEDRRSDVLVAVDVSGSMQARAPGSDRALLDLVKEGFADLGTLLPDSSELGLWEFGVRLQPPDDHRVLLPRGALTPQHRSSVTSAVRALQARDTGTGLHDTVLAGYTAARDRYREGVPNHVVVFTDGRNEADPGSPSMEQLSQALAAAVDAERPVQLTVVTFGDQPEAAALKQALEPVAGYVDQLSTADEVGAVFIHVAAGGLHG